LTCPPHLRTAATLPWKKFIVVSILVQKVWQTTSDDRVPSAWNCEIHSSGFRASD